MYAKNRIGVVVPAYKEEQLIGEMLHTIPHFVDSIYVIDDGSPDGTAHIVQEYSEKDNRIILIRHEKNMGVGAAIYTGYKHALKDNMDIVAVMAGDHQMDPRILPHFLDPIIWGMADYTKGNRLYIPEFRKGMSRWRLFGNSILTFLTKLASGYWYIMDPQNGYTAISQRALKTLDFDTLYPGYGYCNDILVKLNVNDIRVVDIVHPARYGNEKSKIKYGRYILNLSKLLFKDFFWRLNMKYALKGFHPLYLFYLFGIFLSFSGSLGFILSLYLKIFQNQEFFIRGVLSLIILSIGIQFLGFAIMVDMQQRLKGPSSIYYSNSEDNEFHSYRYQFK